MPTSSTQGILYVATGVKFIQEASISAETVKKHNPHLPICLITDKEMSPTPPWDKIITLPNPLYSHQDKIQMSLTPWQNTVFLDTDTAVFAPLDELFELLQRFDLAAFQLSSGYHYKIPDVPNSFPEFSSGVIAFQNNPKTQTFFQQWQHYYQFHKNPSDQQSFRHALYLSDLRLISIPPEYSTIPYFPTYAMTDIKIGHGRDHAQLLRMKKRLDRRLGPRAWIPGMGVLHGMHETSLSQLLIATFRGWAHFFHWKLKKLFH